MLTPDLPLLFCTCSGLRPVWLQYTHETFNATQFHLVLWFTKLRILRTANFHFHQNKKSGSFIFKSRSTKVYLASFLHLPYMWSGTHRCCWNIHKWLSHPPWLSESLIYKSLLNRSQCICFPSRQLTASVLFYQLRQRLPWGKNSHWKTTNIWNPKLCRLELPSHYVELDWKLYPLSISCEFHFFECCKSLRFFLLLFYQYRTETCKKTQK